MRSSSRGFWFRRPIVRVPLLVTLVLVGQAAEQTTALAGDLGGVEAQVLALGHLDRDRPEVLEPVDADLWARQIERFEQYCELTYA